MLSRELRSPMTVDEAIAAVRYEVPASDENVVKLAVMLSIFDGGKTRRGVHEVNCKLSSLRG